VKLLLWSFLVLIVASCGLRVGGSDADTTTNAEIVSASALLGEAVHSLGALRAVAGSYAGCGTTSFSACDTTTYSKIRYFSPSGADADGCTRGAGALAQTVFGSSTLTFSNATCSETTGASVTRSFDNHYSINDLGNATIVYSNTGVVSGVSIGTGSLADYQGVTRRGGATVIRTAAGDLLMINGIHRRGLNSGARFTFWHTLYTTDPIHINRVGLTSVIPTGNLYIAHNRGEAVITQNMVNLVFTPTCNYPVGGTALYVVTPTTGTVSSFTVNFTASCGTVTIDGSTTSLAGG
jgi:hypothetical protein